MLSVLIPYRWDGDHRERLLRWVTDRYVALLPDAEVLLGVSPPGPFNRSAAVNEAAGRATGDTLLIADADIVFDAKAVLETATRFWTRSTSRWPWALPYDAYYSLTMAETHKVLGQSPNSAVVARDWLYLFPSDANPEPCVSGLVMVRTDDFHRLGGMDERFVGWGFEDRALQGTLDTHLGHHERQRADCFHLWHPYPPDRTPGCSEAAANRELCAQLAARGWPLGQDDRQVILDRLARAVERRSQDRPVATLETNR